MQDVRLSPTSYIVLGFVSLLGEATPYEIKRYVGQSVGYFWSFPHSRLYAEPERLKAAGYLEENREASGRRRRRYTLTDSGRRALAAWIAAPSSQVPEIRDMATLQLFFGTDPAALGHNQLALARQRLAELEGLRSLAAGVAQPGPRLALDYGITLVRAAAEFWAELARED